MEDVLCGSEHVADAGVTSIYSENDASEWPKGYIVPYDLEILKDLKSGKNSSQRAKEIAELVKLLTEKKLIDYKKFRGGLVFLEIIPKSPAGKILRRELKNHKGIEIQLYETSAERRAKREAKL